MTREEILAKASQALEDEGLIHFTSTDLLDSLNDGYALTALICEVIEKVIPYTVSANAQIDDVLSNIPDYYRVFAIYSETANRWLNPCAFKNIQQNGVRWGIQTGNIREFCPLGDRHILWYPSPVVAQNLQIFYRAEVSTLSSGEVPNFFEDCHKLLVNYICSDLLDQNLEYTKSNRYFELFLIDVAEVKKRMNSRSLAAAILELSCQSIVTPTSLG